MSEKVLRYTLVIVGILVLGWCIWVGAHAPKGPQLTIIHANDTHSQFEPIRSGDGAGLGGALERAAYIDSVRKADGFGNVLLLHAGDFCQGTSYFSELRGAVEVPVMNALKYDVVTLGNHEFDNGIEALGDLLEGLEMPVVVCNYDFSPFKMGQFIKPYVVLERAGMRIGIVGVLCGLKEMVAGDIANRIPEYDTVPTVQKYVDQLRPECDLIIALTHIGYTEHNPGDLTDPLLCAATRGIDVFVGGHSHTFMSEPAYVKNLDGKRIPIVQTGELGRNMGEFHYRK